MEAEAAMLQEMYPGSVQSGSEITAPLPLPGSGLSLKFSFPEDYPDKPFDVQLLYTSAPVPQESLPSSLNSLFQKVKDSRSTFIAVDGIAEFLKSNPSVLVAVSKRERASVSSPATSSALSAASKPSEVEPLPSNESRGEGPEPNVEEEDAQLEASFSPASIQNAPGALYPIIDSHAHLLRSFGFSDTDIDREVKKFIKLGGLAIVNMGDNAENSQDALRTVMRVNEWASKSGLSFRMFCAAGLHPYNAKANWEEEIEELQKFYRANTQYINSRAAGKKPGKATEPERRPIVAVGECGLDFRTPERRDNERFQIHVLHACCELAVKYDLPIVLHGHRPNEVERMIKEIEGRRAKYNSLRGIFHGFNGTPAQAEYLRSLCGGFVMSVNGSVTFQGTNVRKSVQKAGVDKVLLETDSPYMVPKELEDKGVKRNGPTHVYDVCNKLASLLDIYPQLLAEKSVQAAKEMYRLDI